ncbi:lysine biosynthesis protein LysW [Candidatus Microgenomates bacterium]|nr:lysine biosynthesis protein LysW [Candidatus Microgenomates bacterium]
MQAQCPICDANITLSNNIEVAEIITCTECKNRLEVGSINQKDVVLKEAPKVEEDWGQ